MDLEELRPLVRGIANELRRNGYEWDAMYPIIEERLGVTDLRGIVKIGSSGRRDGDGTQFAKVDRRQNVKAKRGRAQKKRNANLRALSDDEITDWGKRNFKTPEEIRAAIARERRAKAAQNAYATKYKLERDHIASQAKGQFADRWNALNPGDASEGRQLLTGPENREKSDKEYKSKIPRATSIQRLYDTNTPLQAENLETWKPPRNRQLNIKPGKGATKVTKKLGALGKLTTAAAATAALINNPANAGEILSELALDTIVGDIEATNTAPGTLDAELRRVEEQKALALKRDTRPETPQEKQRRLRRQQEEQENRSWFKEPDLWSMGRRLLQNVGK